MQIYYVSDTTGEIFDNHIQAVNAYCLGDTISVMTIVNDKWVTRTKWVH